MTQTMPQWTRLVVALGLALFGARGALAGDAHHHDDHHEHEETALHAPTMFGGPTQDGALVYVRNVTNRSVRLRDKRIVGENGVALSFDVDTCGDRIPPLQTCVFYNESDIVGGRAYAASVTVRDAPGDAVRAQLEIRCSYDTPSGPLARGDLR